MHPHVSVCPVQAAVIDCIAALVADVVIIDICALVGAVFAQVLFHRHAITSKKGLHSCLDSAIIWANPFLCLLVGVPPPAGILFLLITSPPF